MIELPVASAPARPTPPARPLGPDLLRVLGLRRFVRWRYARLVLQVPLLLLALFLVVDGFTGRQLAPRNLATTTVWLHYRGLVVVALLVVGNLFCAACPLMLTRGPARFLKGLLRSDVRWPRAWRSKWLVVGLLLAFFFAYEAFDLWASPWLTAWLVVGYFLAALAVDTLFPAGTFCRYVCPLGNFNFALASVSPTRIATVDPDVCDRCAHKPCLHGRITDTAEREGLWRGPDGALRGAVDGPRRAAFVPQADVVAPNGSGRFPGCETELFVPALTSTMDCTLCLNCVRACPYDNVALRLRPPWHEVVRDAWRHRGGRSVLAMGVALAWWGMLNAFAMVPPFFAAADAVAAALGTRSETLVLAVLFTGVTVLGGAATLAAASLADRAGGARGGLGAAFDRWAIVVVVLGVGFWSAHYLFHFLTGAASIVPVFEHFFAYRGAAIDPNWRLAQLVPTRWLFPIGAALVSAATALALAATARIALRDFGRRGALAMWPMGLFVLAVAAVQVLVLGLPMEMRGTLLGPL
jgi:polyferredoxin